jgi:hypothetical protein
MKDFIADIDPKQEHFCNFIKDEDNNAISSYQANKSLDFIENDFSV